MRCRCSGVPPAPVGVCSRPQAGPLHMAYVAASYQFSVAVEAVVWALGEPVVCTESMLVPLGLCESVDHDLHEDPMVLRVLGPVHPLDVLQVGVVGTRLEQVVSWCSHIIM